MSSEKSRRLRGFFVSHAYGLELSYGNARLRRSIAPWRDLAACGSQKQTGNVVRLGVRSAPNYAAHFSVSSPFLLATPDKFFWWVKSSQFQHSEPDYITEAAPILRPYLQGSGREMDSLSPPGFEATISLWLRELTEGLADRRPLSEPLGTDLADQLVGAVVV